MSKIEIVINLSSRLNEIRFDNIPTVLEVEEFLSRKSNPDFTTLRLVKYLDTKYVQQIAEFRWQMHNDESHVRKIAAEEIIRVINNLMDCFSHD